MACHEARAVAADVVLHAGRDAPCRSPACSPVEDDDRVLLAQRGAASIQQPSQPRRAAWGITDICVVAAWQLRAPRLRKLGDSFASLSGRTGLRKAGRRRPRSRGEEPRFDQSNRAPIAHALHENGGPQPCHAPMTYGRHDLSCPCARRLVGERGGSPLSRPSSACQSFTTAGRPIRVVVAGLSRSVDWRRSDAHARPGSRANASR